MSAYLHYGMMSPLRLAREVATMTSEGANKWLDELLVWRELAYTFCFHRADHATIDAVPVWARATLAEHESDARDRYDWERLARGQTCDAFWNAMQHSILAHGEIHNNVRMTWGKAFTAWTPNAARALALSIDLNHRYALDGRDPASYGGLLWCLGQFDRPFTPPNRVLGTVRGRATADRAARINVEKYTRHVQRTVYASPKRVAVIGAGLAGLSCARTLADHNIHVTVFEKSRGLGGRCATRRDGRSIVSRIVGAMRFPTLSRPMLRCTTQRLGWVLVATGAAGRASKAHSSADSRSPAAFSPTHTPHRCNLQYLSRSLPQMTYARERLWLGIAGVGGTVLFAAAGIAFDLPHRFMDPLADQAFSSAVASVALVWMLHAALLAPIDIIGGLIVVRERPGVMRWIAGWLRGVTVQWLWYALVTTLLLRTGQQFGITSALLVFLLLQLVLLSRQGLMAWLAGGVRMQAVSPELIAAATAAGISPRSVREVDADDPSFVGAWTGADAQRLWVPQRWVRELSTGQLTVALARRAGVRALGLRRRGVLVAATWNTIGFALAASMPRAELVTAAGFVTVIAWFTLWSFAGVLVLPTVSRPAVIAADRWARSSHDADVVVSTITQLDAWQDDEADRAPGVEAIFHPVPSRSVRLLALRANDAPTDTVEVASGAWHATRMMLYLSWAGIGGLSRAVHCNIGRPALWVMLPGD